MSNSWYDSDASTQSPNAPTQSASNTAVWTPSGSPSHLYGKWGVAGIPTSPAFASGYANKTAFGVDIVDVDNLQTSVSLNIHPLGALFGADHPYLTFIVGRQNSSYHRKGMTWEDQDGVKHDEYVYTTTPADTSFYQHTYSLEIYDYELKVGSDSVARATWQWKLLEDGSVLFESHNGTTQLHNRFGAQLPSGDTAWCDTPRTRLTVFGFGSIGCEFDNLNLMVNGDNSCHSGAPPV